MGARFRSWWQNIRKPLDAVIVALLVVIIVLVVGCHTDFCVTMYKQREGAKLSSDLASGLFCYVPFHNIRYGIMVAPLSDLACFSCA